MEACARENPASDAPGTPIGKTRRMNARVLLAAPLLALGLVACGDDDSGGSAADFCTQARAIDEGAFADFAEAETPEAVEAGVKAATEALDDIADAAPSEIKSQVEQLAEVYGDLADGLESHDWDIEAYFLSDDSAEVFERLASDDLVELESYLADECGIDTEN